MSRRPSCTCGRKDCQRCQGVAKNRRHYLAWKARRAKAVPPAKLVKGGGYPPAMWELGLAPDADDDRSHPYTCCCQICCDWWDGIQRRPTDEQLDARWDCRNDVEGE